MNAEEIRRKRRGTAFNESGLALPNAPVQRSRTVVDPIAAQALQENIDNAANPDRKYVGNTGKKNSYVDTYQNKTAGVETQIKNTPNVKRGRQRDIAFRDLEGPGYEQRSEKGSAYDRKLRSNVVKDQISRGLPELKSGDRITANPTNKARARLYQQVGGQAFAAVPDRHGDLLVDGRMTRDGHVINSKGKKVDLPDIKGLRSGLGQMAVKRLIGIIGGPPLQALLTADSLVRQQFGVGLFEHAHNEKMDALKQIEGWGPNLGMGR
jgi:hypothetical protein